MCLVMLKAKLRRKQVILQGLCDGAVMSAIFLRFHCPLSIVNDSKEKASISQPGKVLEFLRETDHVYPHLILQNR